MSKLCQSEKGEKRYDNKEKEKKIKSGKKKSLEKETPEKKEKKIKSKKKKSLEKKTPDTKRIKKKVREDCKCYVCGKGFNCESTLRNHLSVSHGNSLKIQNMKNLYSQFYTGGGFKFYCKLCTKMISSSRGIIYHLGRKHRCIDDLIKDQLSSKTSLLSQPNHNLNLTQLQPELG